MIPLLIWNMDGNGFTYLERNRKIEYVYDEEKDLFFVMADDYKLGFCKSEDEAKRVIINIASAFSAASVEVDPW